MRKAEEFKSFSDLFISERAIDLLNRKSSTIPASIEETDTVQKMILWGRQILPDLKENTSKYIVEFLKALDECDLLRHDFTTVSLNIGRLYQDVYFGETTPYLVFCLSDFHTNRAYERYQVASWGDSVYLTGAIESIISDSDAAYAVISYYGITDGVCYTIEEIAKQLDLKWNDVYNRFRKSMDILRDNKGQLPELFRIEHRTKARIDPSKRPYYMYSYIENKRNHDNTGNSAFKLLATL